MMRLPAARLLPMTIVVTAMLLGLKSLSLGQAALASDPRSEAPAGRTDEAATQANPPAPQRAPIRTASLMHPAPNAAEPGVAKRAISMPSDWPLLQDLRERREALERRERALDLRDAALQAATQTLQTKLAELRSLKSDLQALETARKQRSETSWIGIVKLYEAMRPADAALIFNALDVHLLVQILDRMNERKAASIMGTMEPERARLATQMLALYRQRRDADPVVTTAPDTLSKLPGAG